MQERNRQRGSVRLKIPAQPVPRRPQAASLAKIEVEEPEPAWQTQEPPETAGDQSQRLEIEGVYIISVAARLLDMHPQTLRKYERLGLINPGRTLGMLRLYSREDILKVQLIRRLGDMGLNLAGIEFALSTAENLHTLNRRLQAKAQDKHSKNAIGAEIDAVLRSLNLEVEE